MGRRFISGDGIAGEMVVVVVDEGMNEEDEECENVEKGRTRE